MAVLRKEKDYRAQGIIVTVLLHAILLVLFYFLALRVPDPPLTDFGGGGSELTYGDPAGELDVSNLLASNSDLVPTPQEEIPEEKVVEPTDEPEEITSDESDHEDAVAVAVKEEKKKKPEPRPKTETNEKKEDEPKVDDRFTMPSKNKSGAKKGDPNGNTDKPGQTGKGDGFGGGEGGGFGKGKGPGIGSGLAGWKFISDPYPKDDSQESGVLVFKIYVNRKGMVEKVETDRNQGVNPTTLNIYKAHVKSLRFEPPAGVNVPELTISTLTYDLSSR